MTNSFTILRQLPRNPTVTFARVRGRGLQRKCACGGSADANGECEACRKKRLSMQRSAANAAQPQAVPGIVHEVLRSPGQPLDSTVRASAERYFGYDFSRVRVHTDPRAAKSARAVNALAYAAGNNVVFDTGQYSPTSAAGKRLLTHELTHVVQQGGSSQMPTAIEDPNAPEEMTAEANAKAALQGQERSSLSELRRPVKVARTVGSLTNCPANTNGSRNDPLGDLGADDARAGEIAANAVAALSASPVSPEVLQTFQTRFGLPPAQGTGFLNRLTGQVRPSQDVAINEEIQILRRRYQLVARLFSQPIAYRCIGGAASFAGCNPPHCNDVFAWSCRDTGAIFVCPEYWNDTADSVDQRGAVLVHEAFHIVLGPSNPSQQGEVGDVTVRGPGRNFVVADCYSGFAADLAGVTNPGDSCPPAP